MNIVALIGNLTRDPEVRYSHDMAIASFSIAINRPRKKDGSEGGADFPRITVFGKQAENCERFLHKGSKVSITGRIQTGSYEKDGQRIYTTDVIADRVGFLGRPQEETTAQDQQKANTAPALEKNSAWEAIKDDDIPF